MRILFGEERTKAYSVQQVAKELEKLGHKISWLIYNHSIKIDCGSVNIIPYPKKEDLVYDESELNTSHFDQIARSDRRALYYGVKDKRQHYPYYWKKVGEILEKEKPDVVFAAPSGFYNHMCRLLCEQKGIPIYTESISRYPRRRMSFILPDKYRQVSTSGDQINFKDAKKAWMEIVSRSTRPEYMDRFHRSFFNFLKIKLNYTRYQFKQYLEYLKGERYLQKSLFQNFRARRNIQKNNILWNKYSLSGIANKDTFKILFPLQFQPEYNLDVLGVQYRDQTETIKNILANLPQDCVLFVKPNPATGLEINHQLLQLIQNNKNVYSLGTDVEMADIFNDVDMVITVTGTVSIECIFSEKPVLTLAETEVSKFTGCVQPSGLEDLPKLIEQAKAKEFPLANDDEKYRFYSHLLNSSHAGEMQDFIMIYGRLMGKENLKNLVAGYCKLLDQLQSGLLDFYGKKQLTQSQGQQSDTNA